MMEGNHLISLPENRQDRFKKKNNNYDKVENKPVSSSSYSTGNSVYLPQYVQGLLPADVKQEENIKELSTLIRKMQEDAFQLELAMAELFSDCATMFNPEFTHIVLQAKERLEKSGILSKNDVEMGNFAIADSSHDIKIKTTN